MSIAKKKNENNIWKIHKFHVEKFDRKKNINKKIEKKAYI